MLQSMLTVDLNIGTIFTKLYVYKIIGGALLKGVCSLLACSFPDQLGYFECEMSLELRVSYSNRITCPI